MDSVVTIWLLLLLAAVAALAGLALPRDVHRPRQVSAWLAEHAGRKAEEAERRAAEAAESIRYAEEVAVAARGAANTAGSSARRHRPGSTRPGRHTRTRTPP